MDDLGLIYDVVLGRNRHRQHQHREREIEQDLLAKAIIINNLCCLNQTDLLTKCRQIDQNEIQFACKQQNEMDGGQQMAKIANSMQKFPLFCQQNIH